jgi:hypothetical protein
MQPQLMGPTHERGFYIIWDTTNWKKDRVCLPSCFNSLRILRHVHASVLTIGFAERIHIALQRFGHVVGAAARLLVSSYLPRPLQIFREAAVLSVFELSAL